MDALYVANRAVSVARVDDPGTWEAARQVARSFLGGGGAAAGPSLPLTMSKHKVWLMVYKGAGYHEGISRGGEGRGVRERWRWDIKGDRR